MVERSQIYKCEACGNIVVVLHGGAGDLVCCEQEMCLMEANTVDAAVEKHVPIVKIKDRSVNVQVGSTPHPMEADHYIEMICVHTQDDEVFTSFLKPGDVPEAKFTVASAVVFARAYCNKHGLWKSD
jgi:superoxide reductase